MPLSVPLMNAFMNEDTMLSALGEFEFTKLWQYDYLWNYLLKKALTIFSHL